MKEENGAGLRPSRTLNASAGKYERLPRRVVEEILEKQAEISDVLREQLQNVGIKR